MKNDTHEYFFVLKDESNPRLPELMPDADTAGRRFRFQQQPVDSPPLRFSNGFRHDFKHAGRRDQVADVLFDGANFLVTAAIGEQLRHKGIAHLIMHPAIYVDDEDRAHEGYWYIGFKATLDCWDRTLSDYEQDDPVVIGNAARYAVYSYALDHSALDRTPLSERLLFEMGGTTDGRIVCHESLVHLFNGPRCGTRLARVDEA